MSTNPSIRDDMAIVIDYVNHKGERTERRIKPDFLWWGHTEWHPRDGWLLHAYDFDKRAWRDFSWHGILGPGEDPRTALLVTTRIGDPPGKRVSTATIAHALAVLEFQEHLRRNGHDDMARDMVTMGLLYGVPRRREGDDRG